MAALSEVVVNALASGALAPARIAESTAFGSGIDRCDCRNFCAGALDYAWTVFQQTKTDPDR